MQNAHTYKTFSEKQKNPCCPCEYKVEIESNEKESNHIHKVVRPNPGTKHLNDRNL